MGDSDVSCSSKREGEDDVSEVESSTSADHPSSMPPTEESIMHALRASGKESSLTRLTALNVQPASATGENFLGELWRARVTLEDTTGAPHTRALIIKRVPVGDMREEYLRESHLFEVETAVYTIALPSMLSLLRRAYGDTFRPFWPKFIHASLDYTELIMEDMSYLGYTMADRKVGLDLSQCEAVIKSMALLHASSVALFNQDSTLLCLFHPSVFGESTRMFLETYIRGSMKQLAMQLREWPDTEQYSDRIAALDEKVWDLITIGLERNDMGFNVLNHGDLWVNNVLFNTKDAATSTDLEVALIDWQNTVWTSPALDLLYFQYTSPTDEVRRENWEALLQLYHATLQQAMQALGVGTRTPSLDTLKADLRRRFAFAIFPVFAELPNILAPSDLYYDISQYFDDAPPRNRCYAAEPYSSIIRRLLPLFEDFGVI